MSKANRLTDALNIPIMTSAPVATIFICTSSALKRAGRKRALRSAGLGPGTLGDTTMKTVCSWPKPVSVREYDRFRLGQWEHVRSHCRSYPTH